MDEPEQVVVHCNGGTRSLHKRLSAKMKLVEDMMDCGDFKLDIKLDVSLDHFNYVADYLEWEIDATPEIRSQNIMSALELWQYLFVANLTLDELETIAKVVHWLNYEALENVLCFAIASVWPTSMKLPRRKLPRVTRGEFGARLECADMERISRLKCTDMKRDSRISLRDRAKLHLPEALMYKVLKCGWDERILPHNQDSTALEAILCKTPPAGDVFVSSVKDAVVTGNSQLFEKFYELKMVDFTHAGFPEWLFAKVSWENLAGKRKIATMAATRANSWDFYMCDYPVSRPLAEIVAKVFPLLGVFSSKKFIHCLLEDHAWDLLRPVIHLSHEVTNPMKVLYYLDPANVDNKEENRIYADAWKGKYKNQTMVIAGERGDPLFAAQSIQFMMKEYPNLCHMHVDRCARIAAKKIFDGAGNLPFLLQHAVAHGRCEVVNYVIDLLEENETKRLESLCGASKDDEVEKLVHAKTVAKLEKESKDRLDLVKQSLKNYFKTTNVDMLRVLHTRGLVSVEEALEVIDEKQGSTAFRDCLDYLAPFCVDVKWEKWMSCSRLMLQRLKPDPDSVEARYSAAIDYQLDCGVEESGNLVYAATAKRFQVN